MEMEEYEVSLKDYIDVLRKEKLLILAIFLVAVVSATLFSLGQPKQYETRTTLLISPRVSEELGELGTATLSTETYERLAVTNDLLADIIKSLNLKGDAEALTIEALRGRMEPKAEFVEKGRAATPLPLLTMTVSGSDPVEIKAVAEEWGRLFIERNAELLSTRTAQSYEFVSERYTEVSQELVAKEEEKRAYLEKNPVEALRTELNVSKATYEDFLSQLNEKKRELNENEAKLLSLERELAKGTRSSKLDESVLTQIALENEVYTSVEDYLIAIRVSVDVLKKEVSYLEKETGELKSGLDEKEARINEIKLTLSGLNREISSLTGTYKFLYKKVQEARISKEEQLNSIRMVESPIVPQVPSGPSRKINVVIAGVLGLFIGVFAAFFKNYMEESS
ncbi:MAG: GNVR domain-containing protein [Candidatus Hydrothermarchaeales archaeon]